MKKRLFVSFALTFLVLPSFSSAATVAELQAQLQVLMAQIATLQVQTTVSASSQSGIASCPNLTRNLSRGMRGDDVVQLQRFLISQKYLAADNDSGFYGALTESAVKQFQCQKISLCSGSSSSNGYGAAGPKTRNAIALQCKAATTQPKTSADICAMAKVQTTCLSGQQIVGYGECGGVLCGPITQQSAPTVLTSLPPPTAVNSGTSCILDGATVANGTSKIFYSRRDVGVGLSCDIVARSRTCTNGTLTGDASFAYANCAVRTARPEVSWPQYPNFKVTMQPGNSLSINIQGFQYPSEISPIFLPNPKSNNTNGVEKVVILPGSSSRICLTSSNILSGSIFIPQSSCYLNAATADLFKEDTTGNNVWTDPSLLSSKPWTYSYDGIFTAAINTARKEIFFGRVFENQSYVNRWITGARDCSDPAKSWTYPSTILPTAKSYCTCAEQEYQCAANENSALCVNGNNICPADLSDVKGNIHSWPTYTAGLTMGASSYSDGSGYTPQKITDYGPVAWPQQNGYSKAGVNIGWPAAIVKDDYLYLYYMMTPAPAGQNGGAYCYGLMRSPLSGGGRPGTWQNFAGGSFGTNPLPSGFSLGSISSFFTRSGGAADCVSPPANEAGERQVTNWFHVARVKDTQFYIAVEESALNWGTYQQVVRFSTDLIHWSPKQVVDTASAWGQGKYTYGRYLNKTGSDSTVVDADEFYLYGKNIPAGFTINSAKLSVISRPPAERYAAVIDHYYMHLLNRPATQGEISTQSSRMNSGGCPAVVQDIVRSSEFLSRSSSLSNSEYVKTVARALISRVLADNDGGLQWYVANLTPGGFTRDSMVTQMSMIPESVSACGFGLTL